MRILKQNWFVFSLLSIFLLIVVCLTSSILFISSFTHQSLTRSLLSPYPTANAFHSSQQSSSPSIHYHWGKNARLEIPAIALTAPIEEVGVENDGVMAVPHRHPWEGVGWYKFGTFPGNQGSAVLDGHLDRPGGYPAVFWNLNKLRPGDTLHLFTGAKILRFQVQALEYYRPQDAPLSRIFGDRNGVHLNLITCAGAWVPALHQTTMRLVVYAVILNSVSIPNR